MQIRIFYFVCRKNKTHLPEWGLAVFVVGAPLWHIGRLVAELGNDRRLVWQHAMKRIHRIDAQLLVIWRTKECDLNTNKTTSSEKNKKQKTKLNKTKQHQFGKKQINYEQQ